MSQLAEGPYLGLGKDVKHLHAAFQDFNDIQCFRLVMITFLDRVK